MTNHRHLSFQFSPVAQTFVRRPRKAHEEDLLLPPELLKLMLAQTAATFAPDHAHGPVVLPSHCFGEEVRAPPS